MALTNVTEYKDFVNRLLWYIDNNYGGIDRQGLWVSTGMVEADLLDRLDNGSDGYKVFKKAFKARPASSQNGTPATNRTTFGNG